MIQLIEGTSLPQSSFTEEYELERLDFPESAVGPLHACLVGGPDRDVDSCCAASCSESDVKVKGSLSAG